MKKGVTCFILFSLRSIFCFRLLLALAFLQAHRLFSRGFHLRAPAILKVFSPTSQVIQTVCSIWRRDGPAARPDLHFPSLCRLPAQNVILVQIHSLLNVSCMLVQANQDSLAVFPMSINIESTSQDYATNKWTVYLYLSREKFPLQQFQHVASHQDFIIKVVQDLVQA